MNIDEVEERGGVIDSNSLMAPLSAIELGLKVNLII